MRQQKKKTAVCIALLLLTGACCVLAQEPGPVAPWMHGDVGAPVAGDAVAVGDGVFEITGAGADIWGNGDNCHYMFIEMTGDGAMQARVTDVGTGTSNWTKGGVMIRETLDGGSINVFVAITGGDGEGATFQWRNATDGASASNRTKPAPVAPPYWIRLVREGDTFSGFLSEDGENWYQEGASQEIVMADPVYVGIAVTSHTAGELRTVTVDNISGEGGAALGNPAMATLPVPAADAMDVLRDADLSWEPGIFAVTHDVYFSTDIDSVNDGTALVAEGLTDAGFDPGRLAFSTTYYWRVDEVNGAPDRTVYPGDVWSFTVEPETLPVTGVSVTASSAALDSEPVRTIDGSGLSDGAHDADLVNMWLTDMADVDGRWIQYDLGQAYKLQSAHVWNHNSQTESFLGYGIKEARIETSTDGETWTEFGIVEIPQAPGKNSYTGSDVALDGVLARYVKVTAVSNYSALGLAQAGLSEVQFSYIPVQAREPQPADGSATSGVDITLDWRAGREAAQHEVLFSEDKQAVIDGSAVVGTTEDTSYDLGSLTLSTDYFWKINEVNEAETPAVYEGDLWTFSTPTALVIDDMESYQPEEGLFIWETWVDGFGDDDNGSVVGNGDDPEYTEVYEGSQSLPMAYDNTAPRSEATRSFDPPLDLTTGDPDSLDVYFKGLPYELNGYYSVDGSSWTLMSWSPQYAVMSADALVGMCVTSHDAALETTAVYSDVKTTGNVTGAWTQADIGGTHPAGNFTEANGSFTIKAMGADIWNAADEFRYVYKHLDGAGSISAQVESLDPVNGWTKVGVMIRDTEAVGSSFTAVYATGVNGVRYQARLDADISAVSDSGVLDGTQEIMEPPVWLRMERKAANAAGMVYLTVTDTTGKSAKIAHPNAAATQLGWTLLSIPMADLAGINTSRVETITLGVEGPSGQGTVFVDYLHVPKAVLTNDPGTEGLLAIYAFEGNALDGSGNGLDGTVTDGEFVDAGVPGMGLALQLNGAGNVDLGNPALLDFGTEDWTVAAWFKTGMTGTGDANKGAIVAKGGDSGGGHRYALIMSESTEGAVTLVVDDNVTKVLAHSSSLTNDSEWHHVAGQRKGTSIHIYIDGMVEATSDVTAEYDLSGTAQHNAYIGAVTNNGDGTLYKVYYGLVDDVRIYHRALSEGEVLFLSGQ
jgi:hypothetical protein